MASRCARSAKRPWVGADDARLQLHAQDEALSVWSPDVPHVPPQRALFQFMIAVSLFVGYAALVPALQVESPAARRSYPHDGLVKELGGLEANKVRMSRADATSAYFRA